MNRHAYSGTVPERPLLFAHSLGGSADVTWKAVRDHLESQGVPTLAVDLPGHAGAAHLEFSWAECVRTITTAAEPGPPPVVVGLSLGAAAALKAAIDRPDRVSGLVLTGAGLSWTERSVRRALTVAGTAGALFGAAGFWRPFALAQGHRGQAAKAAAGTLSSSSPRDVQRAALELSRVDVRDMQRPSVPAAVIVLSKDRRMPPGLQRRLAAHLSAPSVDLAEDHDAPVTAPGAFAAAVLEAVAQLDVGDASSRRAMI